MYHPATQTLLSVTVKDHRVAGIALFFNQSLSPQHFRQLMYVLAKAAVVFPPSANPIMNSD